MILDGTRTESIDAAVRTLRAGGIVAMPTETVYGLAADAENGDAVAAIYAAKGRPSDHPLILHVADADAVTAFAQEVPGFARALMDAFWPGPLTLILPRRAGVAAAAAAGQPSVGLRCPAHPVAQALLRAAAAQGIRALAAPSANRFGRISPTRAEHVVADLGERVLVLDGGPCAVGIESTIVDATRGAPVLLRPGQIDREALAAAAGMPILDPDEVQAGATPKASGTLAAHYAPRAPVRLMSARELQTALELLGADAARAGVAVYARSALPNLATPLARRMPDDAGAAAQQLFDTLRGFDDAGARLIWVELPPDTPAWEGVRDRLRRAAAAATGG